MDLPVYYGLQGILHKETIKDGYTYQSGTFYYEVWNETLFKINCYKLIFNKEGYSYQSSFWEEYEIVSSESKIMQPLQSKSIKLFTGKTILINTMPFEMELEKKELEKKELEEIF